ncbi:MAG: hypothetical protein HKP58_12905 [Desulfatitalea sp.]|nr:hypothetical protein [Desulfatitalea sp.]NNK01299.1 hypothetical protein [Desulfatitalea sp.]
MTMGINKFKPAVGKPVLLFLAAMMWIGVGILLLSLAYTWLHHAMGDSLPPAAAGVGAGLVIHHFGFLKIVDKNLARIQPMEGKRCLFSFLSWKSYLIVVVMMAMGITLRHSSIPKPYLATLYIAIGLALILSSIRYLRALRVSA